MTVLVRMIDQISPKTHQEHRLYYQILPEQWWSDTLWESKLFWLHFLPQYHFLLLFRQFPPHSQVMYFLNGPLVVSIRFEIHWVQLFALFFKVLLSSFFFCSFLIFKVSATLSSLLYILWDANELTRISSVKFTYHISDQV